MKNRNDTKKGKTTNALFFVAVIPPEDIKLEVEELKIKIAEEFNSFHALKSPPHITLVPPFKFAVHQEKEIFKRIIEVCRITNTIKIEVSNFGAFPPRVIFLNIVNNQKLKLLHQQLMINFADVDSTKRFNPHMTLAFRDLIPGMFRKAWTKYRLQKFQASFDVKSIYLLKHDSEKWIVYRAFQFHG